MMRRISDVRESIDLVSAATNIYFDYWKQMVKSADHLSESEDKITFHVFSDISTEKFEELRKELKNVHITLHQIQNLGWPDATLKRYDLIRNIESALQGDLLLCIDADMLFLQSPWTLIRRSVDKEKIVLIPHPGYFRPKGKARFNLYLNNPRFLVRDLYLTFRFGGLGTWEKNKKSVAYVKRYKRKTYFCGGVLFGKREQVIRLCRGLSEQIKEDASRNIIAKWHDESHLNSWATKNSHDVETVALCFDEGAKNLVGVKPIIVAVRKVIQTREQRS